MQRYFNQCPILRCRRSCRRLGALPRLEPCGEGRVIDTVEGSELRTGQTAGSVGLDQSGFLFRCLAEASAPVELHKGVVHDTTLSTLRYVAKKDREVSQTKHTIQLMHWGTDSITPS